MRVKPIYFLFTLPAVVIWTPVFYALGLKPGFLVVGMLLSFLIVPFWLAFVAKRLKWDD